MSFIYFKTRKCKLIYRDQKQISCYMGAGVGV